MSRLLNDLSNLAGNNRGNALYNLAMSSMQQKNYKNAIQSFQNALKEDNSPEMQAMVRPNLGMAYLMSEDYENAIEELVKAVSLKNTNNGYAFIHANLGYAYSQMKNYGLAMREYKKSLEYRPDDAKIHYTLGMLYESKFQTDLAYKELEYALKIEPNNQTYLDAFNKLEDSPILSLKVGRLTQPLLTLGLIVTPSYIFKDKVFLPLVLYVYPESPLKKLVKEGDYLTYCDRKDAGEGIIEKLNAPPGTKMTIGINKSRTVITTIPKIESKLSEDEKIKLYHNWFQTFDSRIVNIWELESKTDKEEAGTKWGYEFESLIRSWSAYKGNDPKFNSAFGLLMEFFQAYVYSGSEDEVHYEINLAKLYFTSINKSIINFFKENDLFESAKYLENQLNKSKGNSNINTRNITSIKRK